MTLFSSLGTSQNSNGVRSKPKSGFTLIEVVIVMAITTGLVTIAFIGQAGLRARANFSDGLERTNSLVQRVKSDAYNTVTGTGSFDTVFFAKVIMFRPNGGSPANSTTIYTVTKNSGGLSATAEPSQTLPNGLLNTANEAVLSNGTTVAASPLCLAFTQIEDSAEPVGYIITGCSTAKLEDITNYSAVGPVSASVKLQDEVGASAKNKGSIDFTVTNMTITKNLTP